MVVVQQMVVLFIVMLVGLTAYKKGIISDEASKKISSLVVNISNPALILSSVIGDNSKIQLDTLKQMLIISMLMYTALMICSKVVVKLLKVQAKDKGMYEIMFVFSNVGFMGLPIIASIYGAESLLYASIFLFPYNLLIYTYGIQVISPIQENSCKKGEWLTKIKKILNNGVLASIAAIIIFLGNIKLPSCINDSIRMIGGLTSPLSMMVIGASLGVIHLNEMIKDTKLIVFTFLKLLVVPSLAALVIKNLLGGGMIGGMTLIMLATPVGSMNAILTQEYGGDYETAAKGVALSTILSVATIPIVFSLFEMM